MMFTNPKTKIILFGSCFFFVLIDFLIVWFFTKSKPFSFTFIVFMITILILVLFGGIVALVVWLFKKQKIDALYIMKKNLVQTCKITQPDIQTPIYMYDNKTNRLIGYFKGYTIIKSADFIDCMEIRDRHRLKDFLKQFDDKKVKQEYLYIIAFKGLKSADTELLITSEKDISSIESNPIIIYDRGFAPKIYEFHILSKYYDMSEFIEMPIRNLVNKYTIEHNLREQVNIIDNAIDLDASFRKAQEKSNIEDYTVNQK